MNSIYRILALAIITPLIFVDCSGPSKDAGIGEYIFRSSWKSGIDERVVVQAPPGAISVVQGHNSDKSLVRVSVRRSDNFNGVANGTPRAELAFAKIFHFIPGITYEVAWSTGIPENYQFDSRQPELFTQILQGPKGGLGSPPFSIRFVNGRYQVEIRDARDDPAHIFVFGNPASDRGKMINWRLIYKADHSGVNSITELYMNGTRVVNCPGCGNAYKGDADSYLKIGIYKWWWKSRPTDVEDRTLYFGNVEVRRVDGMP
ncbi:heparin lyase I family protein [Paraburkholderia acidipaludis]|uniref:heparin lyase I family protein n=1 Tax=Paraburkholderia acidipaludis TaxID=660537 RepID=UPI000A0404EA|nr:heparin lyase I family protein [Paraburkholderia acidipaludis]